MKQIIREKITRVMNTSSDQLKLEDMRRRVDSEFSWDEVARKHIEVYGE